MGSAALFAKKFDKSAKRVKKRLAQYMTEPEDEEKVHDVRTSLRRLEASFLVMPKRFRRRNRKQMDAHKQFFRANSAVRDYDIIMGRIAARAQGELLAQLAAGLGKKRKTGVSRALGMARLVSGMPAAGLKGLKDGELESRMDEAARRLVRKIRDGLPAAVSDRNAVEELHQLRKDLKKLRYVLEVMPAGARRPYEKKVSRMLDIKKGPLMPRLKELQDELGAIHDIDITVQYLASLGQTADALIEGENAERDRLFGRFAKSVSA